MSLSTASLIIPITSLALFAQWVPSFRYHRVLLILEQYFLSALQVCLPAEFDMMASGALIYLANCFIAWRNSDLIFMRTTQTKPLYVENSLQHVFHCEYLPAVFVEKKFSMKKCSFILLYRRMRSFVPKLRDRVGLLILVVCRDMTSRVRFAESRSILQIMERLEASIPLYMLEWSALTMMSSMQMLPLVALTQRSFRISVLLTEKSLLVLGYVALVSLSTKNWMVVPLVDPMEDLNLPISALS